jgi:Trk-type K+ transport system membrane component
MVFAMYTWLSSLFWLGGFKVFVVVWLWLHMSEGELRPIYLSAQEMLDCGVRNRVKGVEV